MARGGFSVTIAAVDGATGTIDKVNKSLIAMRKPVTDLQAANAKLGQSLGQFAKNTGVTPAVQAIGRGIDSIRTSAEKATSGLTKMAPALAAITSAASVAGIAALVSNFGAFGQNLLNVANRAGLATDKLQAMENGARIAGVAAGTLSSGVTALRDNLVDAVGGRAPDFVRMMQTLGLAWRDANGHARDVTEVLPEIADKIAAIKDPTLQARAATALLGGSAEALLPFLRRGAAGMEDYYRKARQYGVISEEGAQAAQKLRESQAELGLAVEGLGNSIAVSLAPVLGPLLTDMAHWIAANRDWIAADITDVVKALGNALKSVNWKAIGDSIVATARAIGDLIHTINTGDGLPDWLRWLLGYKNGPGSSAPPRFGGGSMDPDNFSLPMPGGAPAAPSTGPSWWQRNMPALLGGGGARPSPHLMPGGGPSAVNSAVPPEGRALLDAISVGESDGTYRDQPSSTGAKGRYQFLDSTWREVAGKTGLAAFTPENQDKNAWFYAQERYRISTGRDLDGDLRAGINPAQGLNRIWTSLPGGPERNNATDGFAGRLGANLAADMPQYGPPVPSPIAAAPAAGPSGTANMTIRLAGFPNGTTTAATASGDIWGGPPKVERGMALAAPQ